MLSIFITIPFSAQALTVSPPRIELNIDPGATYEGQYKLVNETRGMRTYYNSFENFQAQGETGTPYFVREDVGLAAWLDGPTAVTLAPGESQIVPYTITVPSDAIPGGYFAAMFWSPNPQETNELQFQVNAKIGILVLLRVNGEIVEDGGLVEFDTIKNKKLRSTLPISFFYRFRNDGSDRLKPDATLTVKNTFGGTALETDANPTKGNVLPLSVRRFEVDWGEDTYVTERGFFQHVKRQWKDFSFGIYKAHLDVTFGQEEETARETVRLVVIPWQLLLTIFIILGILGKGTKFALGSYKKFILAQAQRIIDTDKSE